LGMGRDAAGVVVRCTGDEARPEAPEPRYGGRLSFRFTHCDACILLVSVGDKA
jgi:Ca2+-binding RTX toxin-like protein